MLTHSVSVHNHNPFFLSQTPSLAYTLCKWSALILSLLATFFIIRFRQNTPSTPLLLADEQISSTTSEFEEEEDNEKEETIIRSEGFRTKGSTNDDDVFLRRHSIRAFLSLSEIANSKSVVKLWDTIGLDLDHFYGSCSSPDVSVYQGEHGLRSDSALVVSADENALGNLAVRIWDTRLRRRIPAVITEWGPSLGIESCGVHKVYVKDDGRYGLMVGDSRYAESPLHSVTGLHLDLRWPNSFLIKI